MGSTQHLDHLVLRLSTLKPLDFLEWGRGTFCVVIHRKQTREAGIRNRHGKQIYEIIRKQTQDRNEVNEVEAWQQSTLFLLIQSFKVDNIARPKFD